MPGLEGDAEIVVNIWNTWLAFEDVAIDVDGVREASGMVMRACSSALIVTVAMRSTSAGLTCVLTGPENPEEEDLCFAKSRLS